MGDDGDKVPALQMPHRFGDAELFQKIDVGHRGDLFRIELRCAADGIEVDRADLLQAGQRLFAHAAFADDGPHAELPQNIRLIRLFPDTGGRAGGFDMPVFRPRLAA